MDYSLVNHSSQPARRRRFDEFAKARRVPLTRHRLRRLLCSASIRSPSQLHTIKRVRHSVDQLASDVRNVTSVDLILQAFQRDSERRQHRRRPAQIPALTLDRIDHVDRI
jgi:hypothetical protein